MLAFKIVVLEYNDLNFLEKVGLTLHISFWRHLFPLWEMKHHLAQKCFYEFLLIFCIYSKISLCIYKNWSSISHFSWAFKIFKWNKMVRTYLFLNLLSCCHNWALFWFTGSTTTTDTQYKRNTFHHNFLVGIEVL